MPYKMFTYLNYLISYFVKSAIFVNYLKLVAIDENSMIPPYRQLADAIMKSVEDEVIVDGHNLPFIHDFCVALDVSKNTIEKAFNSLKRDGFISSYPGKGYFIFRTKLRQQA